MNRLTTAVIYSLVTIVLILSGCSGQNEIISKEIKFSSSKTGIVKVMTFNIRTGTAFWDGPNRWNKRRKMVIDKLIDNAPDVIGLQEALNYQIEQIHQALPQYSIYAVGRGNGRTKGEACAILYRKARFELQDCDTFWFSKKPWKPGSRSWGNLFPRICSWVHLVDKTDETAFYVYNLHLDNWSQNSREKSVRLLASRIATRKTEDPFIVMGDFNMELDNPAMMYLQNIGQQSPYPLMVDAWESVNSGKSSGGTYHKFSGRASCPKIDHIPISENIQALYVKIDRHSLNGRYPSDHFPVIATINVPSRNAVLAKK